MRHCILSHEFPGFGTIASYHRHSKPWRFHKKKTKPSTLAITTWVFWAPKLPPHLSRTTIPLKVSMGTSVKQLLCPTTLTASWGRWFSPKGGRLQGFWGLACLPQDHHSSLNTQLLFSLLPRAPVRLCCQCGDRKQCHQAAACQLWFLTNWLEHSVFSDIRH